MAAKKAPGPRATKAAASRARRARTSNAKTARAGKSSTGGAATAPARPRGGERAGPAGGDSAGVDAWIRDVGGWRGETLARVRAAIRREEPRVVEEIKWRKPSNPAGVPVWSYEGILCTGEAYKDRVKFTFMRGASLRDPGRLFNASLTAGTRRAWDLHEGDEVDEPALRALVREAIAKNVEARAG